MNVFVITCCNKDNDSILFVDGVYENEQDAIKFCDSVNKDLQEQGKGIYFDYQENVLL